MTVFNHGLYTIAVGREVTKEVLVEALSRVPADRRPELNWDVLGAYPQLYPDYTLAFCCFNTREIAEAGPLLYHYQPLDPSKLFLPALDAHDGRRPVPGAPVGTDHDLLVGSTTGQSVNYRDRLGDLAEYLPRWVLRAAVSDWLPNGDFTVNTADLNQVGSDVQAVRSYGGLQYAFTAKG